MDVKEDTLIRKVLDLTDVEAFECHGKVVSRYIQTPAIEVVNPLPVFGGKDRIGFATVDPETRDAVIFLVKQCPERLDIENGEDYFIEVDDCCRVWHGTMDTEPLPVKWIQVYTLRLTRADELPHGSILPSMVSRSGI